MGSSRTKWFVNNGDCYNITVEYMNYDLFCVTIEVFEGGICYGTDNF